MNDSSSFWKELLANDKYLVIAHENPDPDSIGSMLAMYHLLTSFGKQAWMMCDDPIPNYSWPNIDQILHTKDVDFENVIVLDCEPERTGKLIKCIDRAKLTFNIDHHKGNTGNCDFNLIDTNQAATCMIIYNLISQLNVELGYELAQPLYGGIVGDTGGFRHSNSTHSVFIAAANLVKHGATPDVVAREIFGSKSINFIKFIGYALEKLQTTKDNQLV